MQGRIEIGLASMCTTPDLKTMDPSHCYLLLSPPQGGPALSSINDFLGRHVRLLSGVVKAGASLASHAAGELRRS